MTMNHHNIDSPKINYLACLSIYRNLYRSKEKARIYYFISIPKGSVRGFRERENFGKKLQKN